MIKQWKSSNLELLTDNWSSSYIGKHVLIKENYWKQCYFLNKIVKRAYCLSYKEALTDGTQGDLKCVPCGWFLPHLQNTLFKIHGKTVSRFLRARRPPIRCSVRSAPVGGWATSQALIEARKQWMTNGYLFKKQWRGPKFSGGLFSSFRQPWTILRICDYAKLHRLQLECACPT